MKLTQRDKKLTRWATYFYGGVAITYALYTLFLAQSLPTLILAIAILLIVCVSIPAIRRNYS